MKEFFKTGKVNYEGADSKNPYAFKHYNPDEMLNGKPMREHLKFALSYWHTLGGEGTDMFGSGTVDKTFGGKTPMETARINNAFGSIDANQGDHLLGWDTDQFPTDVYSCTYCMLEVLKAGGFTNGGLNFDAKPRRASMTDEDIFLSYIAGIDSFALGLKIADGIVKDGRIDEFVKERYQSFTQGIGKKIVNDEMTLETLSDYALGIDVIEDKNSGRQEYLESVVNDIMFKGI